MAKGRQVRHIPKEMEGSKNRDEVGTFDNALRRGQSRVYIDECRSRDLTAAFKNPGVKDQLMDFIFGKTSENPMKSITNKTKAKKDDLAEKLYSKIGVVGLYDEKSNIVEHWDSPDQRVMIKREKAIIKAAEEEEKIRIRAVKKAERLIIKEAKEAGVRERKEARAVKKAEKLEK